MIRYNKLFNEKSKKKPKTKRVTDNLLPVCNPDIHCLVIPIQKKEKNTRKLMDIWGCDFWL